MGWTGQQVLVGEVDGDLIAKYTVLSGAYCLLRYIENCNGVAFSDHSIRCPPPSSIVDMHSFRYACCPCNAIL